MKKIALSLLVFFLLAAIVMFYSEFRTKNFVETFLASPDELVDKVDRFTIWSDEGDGEVESLAIVNPGDEHFEDVLEALNKWEVKRVLFKEMDLTKETYKLDIANKVQPIHPFDIIMTADGMMNIHGQEYELVKGSSIEELVDIAK